MNDASDFADETGKSIAMNNEDVFGDVLRSRFEYIIEW